MRITVLAIAEDIQFGTCWLLLNSVSNQVIRINICGNSTKINSHSWKGYENEHNEEHLLPYYQATMTYGLYQDCAPPCQVSYKHHPRLWSTQVCWSRQISSPCIGFLMKSVWTSILCCTFCINGKYSGKYVIFLIKQK